MQLEVALVAAASWCKTPLHSTDRNSWRLQVNRKRCSHFMQQLRGILKPNTLAHFTLLIISHTLYLNATQYTSYYMRIFSSIELITHSQNVSISLTISHLMSNNQLNSIPDKYLVSLVMYWVLLFMCHLLVSVFYLCNIFYRSFE